MDHFAQAEPKVTDEMSIPGSSVSALADGDPCRLGFRQGVTGSVHGVAP
jgi:hypothetical protein